MTGNSNNVGLSKADIYKIFLCANTLRRFSLQTIVSFTNLVEEDIRNFLMQRSDLFETDGKNSFQLTGISETLFAELETLRKEITLMFPQEEVPFEERGLGIEKSTVDLSLMGARISLNSALEANGADRIIYLRAARTYLSGVREEIERFQFEAPQRLEVESRMEELVRLEGAVGEAELADLSTIQKILAAGKGTDVRSGGVPRA